MSGPRSLVTGDTLSRLSHLQASDQNTMHRVRRSTESRPFTTACSNWTDEFGDLRSLLWNHQCPSPRLGGPSPLLSRYPLFYQPRPAPFKWCKKTASVVVHLKLRAGARLASPSTRYRQWFAPARSITQSNSSRQSFAVRLTGNTAEGRKPSALNVLSDSR